MDYILSYLLAFVQAVPSFAHTPPLLPPRPRPSTYTLNLDNLYLSLKAQLKHRFLWGAPLIPQVWVWLSSPALPWHPILPWCSAIVTAGYSRRARTQFALLTSVTPTPKSVPRTQQVFIKYPPYSLNGKSVNELDEWPGRKSNNNRKKIRDSEKKETYKGPSNLFILWGGDPLPYTHTLVCGNTVMALGLTMGAWQVDWSARRSSVLGKITKCCIKLQNASGLTQ